MVCTFAGDQSTLPPGDDNGDDADVSVGDGSRRTERNVEVGFVGIKKQK